MLRLSNFFLKVILYTITFYRLFISPLKMPTCRFVPTCSEYAMLAFEKYGFKKGLVLTAKRVFRCHPFTKGGYDPLE